MGEHFICFWWNPIVPSIEKIREVHYNVFELTLDREFWAISGSETPLSGLIDLVVIINSKKERCVYF